jgi:hypothetical protein
MYGYPPEADVGTAGIYEYTPELRDVFFPWSRQSVRWIFQNHPMNAPRRGAEHDRFDHRSRDRGRTRRPASRT